MFCNRHRYCLTFEMSKISKSHKDSLPIPTGLQEMLVTLEFESKQCIFIKSCSSCFFHYQFLAPNHYLLIHSLLLRNTRGENKCISQQCTEDHLWKHYWLLTQQTDFDVGTSSAEDKAKRMALFHMKTHRDGQSPYTTQCHPQCSWKQNHHRGAELHCMYGALETCLSWIQQGIQNSSTS